MSDRPHFRRPALTALLVAAALAVAVLALTLPRLERFFLVQAGRDAQATLSLATEVLHGELDRAAPLPALLAQQPILRQLLADPTNEGLLPFTNEQLRLSALALGVSDIYLMDLGGLTIASSNYRMDRSFLGQSFEYRPYFTQAVAGNPGRFHALGTTSGTRGYFFAAPVIDGIEIIGVIAVKVTLDPLEETWRQGASSIMVTDPNDVIFLSDREDWHFRTQSPLQAEQRAQIEEVHQYPLSALRLLDIARSSLADGLERVSITDDASENFVSSTALIASAGWRVSILTPDGPALAQARQAAALIVLAIVIAGLAVALFLQRRAQLLERLRVQREARATLEVRVAARTKALAREVDERRATEDRLRTTQAELVQAGKLAALGQMSAALSHEFNQPLAAVKSYADNADTFLDRGQDAEARRNIQLISGMADRMAKISKHLRNFARRPQDKTGPIPLLATIDEAIAIMQPRLDAAGANLAFDRPTSEITVIGGPIRLSQVIVNLMSNALDAMESQADKSLALSVARSSTGWRISLRDHGPGLGPDGAAQIFDPFFSTKSPGGGLGLGLSISYNIMRDFGGSLSAETHPDGGAVFHADLLAADPADLAAE